MNKETLLEHILQELERVRLVAVNAVIQASETATSKETIARSKYETFGLEASYLAHGQAMRVAECDEDLAKFKEMTLQYFDDTSPIALSALITLFDENDDEQLLFLGPAAGGLKVQYGQQEVVVITPSSPLGKALIGLKLDDDVDLLIGDNKKTYEIITLQ